jgi:hypothetical protein
MVKGMNSPKVLVTMADGTMVKPSSKSKDSVLRIRRSKSVLHPRYREKLSLANRNQNLPRTISSSKMYNTEVTKEAGRKLVNRLRMVFALYTGNRRTACDSRRKFSVGSRTV